MLLAAAVAFLICGCEDAGQSKSIDADIERARAQIAAKTEEKQRIESELRKVDKLVPERHKLLGDYHALSQERDRLNARLSKPSGKPR